MLSQPSGPPATRPVLSVSELARQARLVIEERFGLVWVEGEISNLRRPASGHWYFTLKDDGAQLRCCMFAGRNRAVRFAPRDGIQVLIRGRVSLYEARGDFQLVAEHLEPAGEGALRAAFEALKTRLAAEGLFDAERKRALPALPRRLAVISSSTGAALRDVLHVVARRFPGLEVIVVPVTVQGDRAEADLMSALARAPMVEPDVVLITRGGGSLEDLWAFNLESVARAVAACPVPTVSAVGHQTDVTITDFVADVRAPTPSAGAELITPDRAEFDAYMAVLRGRLGRTFAATLVSHTHHLRHLRARLVSPRARLQQQMQRTDELALRLQRATRHSLTRRQAHLNTLRRGLLLLRPARTIRRHQQRLIQLHGALTAAGRRVIVRKAERLAGLARTLQAVSPLETLARGYAVLTVTAGGEGRNAVTSVSQANPGDALTAHLHDGALTVRVEGVDHDNRLPTLEDADPRVGATSRSRSCRSDLCGSDLWERPPGRDCGSDLPVAISGGRRKIAARRPLPHGTGPLPHGKEPPPSTLHVISS